jgi:hypothetical protein
MSTIINNEEISLSIKLLEECACHAGELDLGRRRRDNPDFCVEAV